MTSTIHQSRALKESKRHRCIESVLDSVGESKKSGDDWENIKYI